MYDAGVKKRSLTLIEVLVALSIASILLSLLFPYLIDVIRLKRNLGKEQVRIFSKGYVQARLGKVLSKAKKGTFKTRKAKELPFELIFEFNNKGDFEKGFDHQATARLFFSQGDLVLRVEGKEKNKREEVLMEGIRDAKFIFSYATDQGKLERIDRWDWDELPLFFLLEVTFFEREKETFYFRLSSPNSFKFVSK